MVTINRTKNKKDEESASDSDYGKTLNDSPVVTDYSSLFYVYSDSVNQEEESDESCHKNDNEMGEKKSFSSETIISNRLDAILNELARAINNTAISKFNIAQNSIWEGTKTGLGRKAFTQRTRCQPNFVMMLAQVQVLSIRETHVGSFFRYLFSGW